MKSISRNVVLAVMIDLCVGMCSMAEDSNDNEPIAKPYLHGHYLVITCHRVEGAGKFPISYSQHEVTAIDGKKLEQSFRTHVEYLDSFDIPGNDEVIISGYFTMKQIGSPSWPEDAPEAEFMDFSQQEFSFVDFFVATGVRSPEEEKKRFEREVVSNRKKFRN
ncbi:MAG: hypothetical protein P1U86_15300 [Verrucomicrobiales bacterium]|nr:hypothetical protein [Verrucomicrobiales bacterium]